MRLRAWGCRCIYPWMEALCLLVKRACFFWWAGEGDEEELSCPPCPTPSFPPSARLSFPPFALPSFSMCLRRRLRRCSKEREWKSIHRLTLASGTKILPGFPGLREAP